MLMRCHHNLLRQRNDTEDDDNDGCAELKHSDIQGCSR